MKRAVFLALAYLLSCTACEERVLEGRPALTREQLLNPETCKDCHPKHYAEWSVSMHAYASRDPVFTAMNQRGQEETDSQLGPFCVNCHAPMAVREDAIRDYTRLDTLPKHLQGVTCYFCHNAVGLGPDHNNAQIELANDNVMRANIERALIPSVHKVRRSALHDSSRLESSRLCGTCHDIVLPNGFHLERTFKEYEDSIYSKQELTGTFQSCQTCHMHGRTDGVAAVQSGIPGVSTQRRKVHDHLFAAVDVPLEANAPYADALRSAVEDCALPESLTGFLRVLPDVRADFVLEFETTAGHRQPSGAAQDRRMWFEVEGYDASGKLIYSEGKIEDGALEPESTGDDAHPCMMRDELLDDQGKLTHMFWEAAKRRSETSTIPPASLGMPHAFSCRFSPRLVQPIPHLKLRLRIRPMGQDVLSDLVASGHLADDVPARMPTLTVDSWHADYDENKHEYVLSDSERTQDCSSYACAIYPNGPGCATQGPTAGHAP